MNNCIFCKIIKGEIPSHKIYEDEYTLAFLDIAPIHPGHTLIVPKQHHENLEQTPHDVSCKCMDTIKKIAPALLKATGADGFNVGLNNGSAAGQAVFHTHFHLIPRFTNDGLKPWPHNKYQPKQAEEITRRIKEQIE